MTGFQILDLLIGVFFIYFILSMISSTLQEIRAGVFSLRSKNLNKWFSDTFKNGESDFGSKIICSALIDGLTQAKRSAAYITKEVFVGALLEEIHKSKQKDKADATEEEKLTPYDFQSLQASIKNSVELPTRIKYGLLQMHAESFQNLDSFKEKIGKWFDEAMERNAGAYKKNAQKWVLFFSFAITIGLNVDSLNLIQYFYNNPEAARQVADAAEAATKDKQTIERVARISKDTSMLLQIQDLSSRVDSIKMYKAQLDSYQLPIGWDNKVSYSSMDCISWITMICGWIITALAVTLGAPFWFDTLNKLVNLRSVGKRTDISSSGGNAPANATDNAVG